MKSTDSSFYMNTPLTRHPREGGDPLLRSNQYLRKIAMPAAQWIPACAGMTIFWNNCIADKMANVC